MRARIEPRLLTPRLTARHLGLSLADFEKLLPALHIAGFPQPIAPIGNYDRLAVETWIDNQTSSQSNTTTEIALEKMKEAIRLGAWGT